MNSPSLPARGGRCQLGLGVLREWGGVEKTRGRVRARLGPGDPKIPFPQVGAG